MSKVKKIIKVWLMPLACGLFIIIVFQFVLMIGYVPSASMEPTIAKGSYIIGTRIYGELKRGDVVIFRKDGNELVKRIAGMPGETVRIKRPGDSETDGIILTVPEGCFYMLGDYEADSFDSRYWADPFVREEDILARLFIR